MDQQPEQPKSFIQIIFADVGSTIFQTQIEGITPLQLLALAEYFHYLGEKQLVKQDLIHQQEQQQKAAQNKIVVPGISDQELLR